MSSVEVCGGTSPWKCDLKTAQKGMALLRLRNKDEGNSLEAQSLEEELGIKPTEETQSAE